MTTVHVGYICPLCERRVTVLSSSSPETLHDLAAHNSIESKCPCGFKRLIFLTDIQRLDSWQETEETESDLRMSCD